MSEIIGLIIIAIGVAFDLLGCIGLVRLPNIYNRLQASTKCVTLGTWCILLGTLVICGFTSIGVKAMLCMVLIALASPTAAHALARGAHKSGVRLWDKSVCDKYEEDKEARL